jgi:hypothetical protein
MRRSACAVVLRLLVACGGLDRHMKVLCKPDDEE